MGRLVRLVRGSWAIKDYGEWNFDLIPSEISYGVMVQENQTLECLIGLVKARYLLPAETAMDLTYQFLEWMLGSDGNRTPLIDIATNGDVEFSLPLERTTLNWLYGWLWAPTTEIIISRVQHMRMEIFPTCWPMKKDITGVIFVLLVLMKEIFLTFVVGLMAQSCFGKGF